MQGIYNYTPEANHVSRVYIVADFPYLQNFATCNIISPVKYVLYFYISNFRTKCAESNRAAFCSSLISCFPGVLLRYCLSDFEMVSVALIITGITFAFIFHMPWISIMRSLYFNIFSSTLLITFLSPDIGTSIDKHVPCLFSRTVMSDLLLGVVLPVCTCWFHNMVTLISCLVSTDFGTCSYQCWFSNLPLFPCVC